MARFSDKVAFLNAAALAAIKTALGDVPERESKLGVYAEAGLGASAGSD